MTVLMDPMGSEQSMYVYGSGAVAHVVVASEDDAALLFEQLQ